MTRRTVVVVGAGLLAGALLGQVPRAFEPAPGHTHRDAGALRGDCGGCVAGLGSFVVATVQQAFGTKR